MIKGVVGRKTIFQIKHVIKPCLFGFYIGFNGNSIISTTNHRTNGDKKESAQLMALSSFNTGISDGRKVLNN